MDWGLSIELNERPMYKFWRDYKFSTTIWEFCKSRGFPYFVVTAEDPSTEHVPSCCLLLNLGKIYTFTQIQEGVAARHVIF